MFNKALFTSIVVLVTHNAFAKGLVFRVEMPAKAAAFVPGLSVSGTLQFEGIIENHSRQRVLVSPHEEGLLHIRALICAGKKIQPRPGGGFVHSDPQMDRILSMRFIEPGESFRFQFVDLVDAPYGDEEDEQVYDIERRGHCSITFSYRLPGTPHPVVLNSNKVDFDVY
jgi:hypothetical protein